MRWEGRFARSLNVRGSVPQACGTMEDQEGGSPCPSPLRWSRSPRPFWIWGITFSTTSRDWRRPEGGAPAGAVSEPMHEQLRRTVIAWEKVAGPDEVCVLWDLDERVGVDKPWGIAAARVEEVRSAYRAFQVRTR